MANPPPLWPSSTDSQTDLLRKILTNIAYSIENGGGGGGAVTKITAGNNITISPVNGLGNVTINAADGGTDNGYPDPVVLSSQATLTTGDYRTTTQKITLSGAAGARAINMNPKIIPFDPTLHTSGDKLFLDLTFPATAGLVLTIWEDNTQAVKLLPVEIFGASQTFTTDGNILSAWMVFVFNGTAWVYEASNLPA